MAKLNLSFELEFMEYNLFFKRVITVVSGILVYTTYYLLLSVIGMLLGVSYYDCISNIWWFVWYNILFSWMTFVTLLPLVYQSFPEVKGNEKDNNVRP